MQVTGFTEDMQRRGKTPSSRLLYAGVQKANHVIANDLGIGLGQDLYSSAACALPTACRWR